MLCNADCFQLKNSATHIALALHRQSLKKLWRALDALFLGNVLKDVNDLERARRHVSIGNDKSTGYDRKMVNRM